MCVCVGNIVAAKMLKMPTENDIKMRLQKQSQSQRDANSKCKERQQQQIQMLSVSQQQQNFITFVGGGNDINAAYTNLWQ